MQDLMAWNEDGICETPTGHRVEANGTGPDGVLLASRIAFDLIRSVTMNTAMMDTRCPTGPRRFVVEVGNIDLATQQQQYARRTTKSCRGQCAGRMPQQRGVGRAAFARGGRRPSASRLSADIASQHSTP